MHIKDFAIEAYENSRAHGFHPEGEKPDVPLKLILIVSEIAEALEEIRSGNPATQIYYGLTHKPEGFPIELADAFIRICDLAVSMGIDLEAAVLQKHEYNKSRPFKHGKAF